MDAEFRSDEQIKIRFNKLVGQFENNSKYTPYEESQTIDENEDISYEISVHDKQYEADFFSETGGVVWFKIGRLTGGYVISMYYESPKNEADGSDL